MPQTLQLLPLEDLLTHFLDHELLVTLGEHLALDTSRMRPEPRASLALFAATGPVLCTRQQHLRLRTADTPLGEHLQPLWHLLQHTHLEPWRVTSSNSTLLAHRAAGPRPDTPHTLTHTLEPTPHIGESLARFYIGFPIPNPTQPTAFLAIAPLDAAGLRRVERLAILAEITLDPDTPSPWAHHRDELLRIGLDPHNRFALPGAFAPPSLVGDIPDVDALTRAVLTHINDAVHNASPWTTHRRSFRRARWARLTIARAEHARDLATVERAIVRLRFHLLSYNERLFLQAFDEGDPVLERLLPTARVLLALGCRPDASVPGAEPENLAREPIALLGLPPEHPLFLEHHAREPIHFARSWARRHDSADIDTAFQSFILEQRWIRTFDHLDLDADADLERIPYDAITHGLHELFHTDFFRTPINQLALEARDARRLTDAMGADATLARLPTRESRVLAIPGLGPTTLLRLKAALILIARGWRAARAGIFMRPAPSAPTTHNNAEATPPTHPEKSRNVIADGLDELAALFDSLE